MKAVRATFPAMGVDTVARLTPDLCKNLKANGMTFAVRYLGGATQQEVTDILASGLALMLVTYSRTSGWVPSKDLGDKDGVAAVARAKALGAPPAVTIWLDLEGCAGPASATTEWVNAWADKIKMAGYEPGLYVGAAPGGLDSKSLYALRVVRYWHSCSEVPEVATCGYCMRQLRPWNAMVGGVQVDVDVIEEDLKHRLPTWIVA